ncbi:hypothetical protein Tco_0558663 [Tanacetum coccineum]
MMKRVSLGNPRKMVKAEEEKNKIAEEEAANEALIKNFDDVKARIEADRILAEKLQEQEREQFTIEERAKFLHDTLCRSIERRNQRRKSGLEKDDESSIKRKLGTHFNTNEGVVIHMLTEKKYPLKKEILVQMLNLRLESEEESTMALELIRFIKKVLADLESKEQD